MLTGYCVVGADHLPPAGLTGVDDAPVQVVAAEGLGVWVSAGAPPGATLERVRQHDAVVRQALRAATPLPLRFGTGFADPDAARAMLRERAVDLHAALQRVAGRVEVGIRLLWRPDGEPPRPSMREAPRSGREYLEQRRAELAGEADRRRAAEALLDQVTLAFAPLDLPTVRQPLPEPGVAGVMAHLVHRSRLGQYRSCAEHARAALQEADLVLTGPWAPYSFV